MVYPLTLEIQPYKRLAHAKQVPMWASFAKAVPTRQVTTDRVNNKFLSIVLPFFGGLLIYTAIHTL